MKARNHISTTLCLLLGLQQFNLFFLAGAFLGSLAPNLVPNRTSIISLFTVNDIFKIQDSTKTWTHSIFAMLLFSAIFIPISLNIGLGFLTGYSLHLFADYTTDTTPLLLYPFKYDKER